ncbi:MAG: YmfQ family protein [Anaeromicrobium sp.]|jgi:hypothetical protein|uniref:YmfQ family protein n=1 Tax=Anaeromicrobium sp. TaxID=1929132 RepID=UPI0025D52C17|nr:YmfQ family protein [Anaeromicrobium sp.]MCT4593192.1 YmfQ family protein [Anaeromicrobium sp.]
MINSPKGRDMISYVSPIYGQSEVAKAIFESIGTEWDNADELAEDILLQLFPQTATWGLIFWELRLGLSTNLSEDIEKRRRRVIAKMQSKYTINPERMAMILKNYTGAEIEIIENIAPHTFEIKLLGSEGFPNSLDDLYKRVKKIKPSHLSVKYKLVSISNMDIYFATFMRTGEEITVYPWTPKDIESKGQINIAMASSTGSEDITIYPKKEG